MNENNLDSLVNLLNTVTNDGHRRSITNPQYVDFYLKIFMDEIAKNNNGEPIPYDAFGERLWKKLNKDVNAYRKEADEFMNIWTGWVHFYRYLNKNK